MTMQNTDHVKSRKPRTIKNGIVNIDDVLIGPGEGMTNWVKIAKHKLKERERILIQRRLHICVNIIITSIRQFTAQHNSTLQSAGCNTSVRMPTNKDLYNLYEQEVGHKMPQIISRFTHSISIILAK
eukprot:206478_1